MIATAAGAIVSVACGDTTGPEGAREVVVSPEFFNLVLGVSRQLTATVRTANGTVVTSPSLSFASSDSAVARVSATGLVTAVSPGTVAITARSEAASASAAVRAVSPAAVALTPPAALLGVGDTVLFTAQVLDYGGAPVPNAPLIFESADSSVAAVVGPQGRVRGVAAGIARLRVRSGTTADSATITVHGPPARVVVTPDSLALVVGTGRQLSVEVRDALGTAIPGAAVTYTAADTTVARVSAGGTVTTVGVGVTSVVANSGTASATIPVVGTAASVTVSPSSAVLQEADTVTLTAVAVDQSGDVIPGLTFTFQSTDSTIARVGATGQVTWAGLGTAQIIVEGAFRQDTAQVVTVGPPAQVLVTPDSLALVVGAEHQLMVEVRDARGIVIPGAAVTYTVQDTTVAQVSAGGVVTAITLAATAVIVTSGVASDTTIVVGAAAVITVSPSNVVLGQSDTVSLAAVARDSSGIAIAGLTFTYQSTDSTIARVSTTGQVTWTGLGTAQIIVEGGFGRDTADVIAIVARVPLGGRPYGVAVSGADVIYVVALDASTTFRIDPATWRPSDSITVGSGPAGVTFNAAGTRAYVTNLSARSVSVLDPATDSELQRIPLPGEPFVAVVTAGDTLLYVSTASGRVYGIALATSTIVDSLQGVVNGFATHDSLLYASLVLDGRVIEYNLRTRAVGRTFPTGGRPQGLAFSADRTELFVADEYGGVQFWNLQTGTRAGTLSLPADGPFGLATQPSTGLVFVAGVFQSVVWVVDPATRTLQRTVPVGGFPRRIAFRANGDAVVTNEHNWVDVLR